MSSPTQKPRPGSWPSPISAEVVASAGLRLSEPRLGADAVYWLEGRPTEGGRVVPMRARFDALGSPEELARGIPDASARSTVHEYGGGALCVGPGSSEALFVDHATQRVRDGGGVYRTPEGRARGDLVLSPDGHWLVCVEEVDAGEGEPLDCIAAYTRGGERIVVAEGHDFFASPRFSPKGDRLAFIAWDHPDMPWDSTGLWELPWDTARGPTAAAERLGRSGLAGPESIVQPEYTPGGRLIAATDRGGWWNLAAFEGGACTALHEERAEFAGPMWVLGLSHYAVIDEDEALCSLVREGRSALRRLPISRDGSDRSRSGQGEDLVLPFELGIVEGVRARDGRACYLAGGPQQPLAVFVHDLASDEIVEVRRSMTEAPNREWISVPEAITYPSRGGRPAHAFHYAPRNPMHELSGDERPPLLVLSHGGPTAATHPVLDLRVQYWTSRGFAVLDVNYAGSTGYGRAYRESLRGAWGVKDVEDCVFGARHLVAKGCADAEGLAITGGSAGGFTTLCALTFYDTFQAGASRYGIGDLEALVRDTHKFESRYTDGLVGAYPAERERYLERSPIHHVEQLSCPVLFLQGLKDRVVPPNQAEAMVDALDRQGIPHALVTFENEGHGFRSQASIRRALECELAFFGAIFGFATDAPPNTLDLRRGEALHGGGPEGDPRA